MNRQPPAFATDSWAWNYTRVKIEEQCGKEYDDWTGPQFGASQVIYRNVLKKYGPGGAPETGMECPKCDIVRPFAEKDYLCTVCRFGV